LSFHADTKALYAVGCRQGRVLTGRDGEIKETMDGVDMDETGHDFSRCIPKGPFGVNISDSVPKLRPDMIVPG